MNNIVPLVSVSVVTYNHKDYIAQCLEGILMQKTNFPFEIILGEDESNDGTRDICIEYASRHPDIIKLFLRSRKDVIYINDKPTGRFNMLENLKASQGKYIALCEGDDYWTDPLKLQKQVDFLEANNDFIICYHKTKIHYVNTNVFKEDNLTRKVEKISTIIDLAGGNYIHTPTVMLRNNFEIPNWFSKIILGDWGLYLIAIKDQKIMFLDEIMAVYRIHDNGLWSKKSGKDKKKQSIATFKFILKNHKELPSQAKQILKQKIKAYKASESKEKRKLLKEKIKKLIKKIFRKLKIW